MWSDSQSSKLLNRLGLGKLSYSISILRVFATYQPSTAWLEVDGSVTELPDMWLAAVANVVAGKSISIQTEKPLLVQADGEFASSPPLQIELIPAAISVISPTPTA